MAKGGVLDWGSLEGRSLCPFSLQSLWDVSHNLPGVLDEAWSWTKTIKWAILGSVIFEKHGVSGQSETEMQT